MPRPTRSTMAPNPETWPGSDVCSTNFSLIACPRHPLRFEPQVYISPSMAIIALWCDPRQMDFALRLRWSRDATTVGVSWTWTLPWASWPWYPDPQV